jgi:hypothetical protein
LCVEVVVVAEGGSYYQVRSGGVEKEAPDKTSLC